MDLRASGAHSGSATPGAVALPSDRGPICPTPRGRIRCPGLLRRPRRHLMRTTRIATSCFLALTLAPTFAAAQQQKGPPSSNGFDAALARYREVMTRLPFRYHTEGREKLAETRKLEALQLLIEDYQKVKAYPEYSRYTLASLFGRCFDNAAAAPVLDGLWKSNNKAVDTWLWVQALRIHGTYVEANDLLDIVATDKNQTHRAAAILALGQMQKSNLKQALMSACLEFPKKEGERAVLIGAMSGAIYAARSRANDADFRDGLKAYISLLGPELKLPQVLKLQIGRHLMWTLNGSQPWVDPESWLNLLERGDVAVKRASDGRTTAQQRFFGIESDGERFCYVLDLSDSMCKQISEDAKPNTGPVTGPRQKKPKGVLPDESDIPWKLVHTRWDLAREELKISLLRLPNDKYFSVVWFGTESGTLESTKGLVRATKANVDRVIAELDSIQARMPDKLTPEELKKSPDGALRGSTNMHSGLRRAFGLTDKGYVENNAYVDPEALIEGCDTIFLLSDGEPSWDDFHIADKDYGEGNPVIDAEYGAAGVRTPTMIYWGPYNQADWLMADLERMNAFRRIRLHCIGLGEASVGLLQKLSGTCHGETYLVGSKKKPAGPAQK